MLAIGAVKKAVKCGFKFITADYPCDKLATIKHFDLVFFKASDALCLANKREETPRFQWMIHLRLS